MIAFKEVAHTSIVGTNGIVDYYDYKFDDFGLKLTIRDSDKGFYLMDVMLENPTKERKQAINEWFEIECSMIENGQRTTRTL